MSEIEIWRGSANAWETDHLGHLNTRFYLAKVEQALPALLVAIGLPPSAPLMITAQHMRFHKEVRPGTAIHATGQVLQWDADRGELLITLYHSVSHDAAATFRLMVRQAPGENASTPEITAATPNNAIERGLSMAELASVQASVARADTLGLQRTGFVTILPDQADGQGIWRLSAAMGLVADAIPHMPHGNWKDLLAAANPDSPRRIGGVLLEFGFVHQRWPRVGDSVEVRSVLSSCTDRITRTAHWLLDPRSKEPWATVSTVGLPLDLDARRPVALTAEAQAAYREAAVSDA